MWRHRVRHRGHRYAYQPLPLPQLQKSTRRCVRHHRWVKRENFRWIKGQERLSTFESSPGKLRHFCSVCGSQLIAERPRQAHVIVRIATLDEDPGIRPQQHIWTAHDAPWLEYQGVVTYPQWQPER